MLGEQDKQYLLKQLKTGNAMLCLGAGASQTSKNFSKGFIKDGKKLAELLAQEACSEYHDEPLTEVYEAVRGEYLSDVQINNILKKEYLSCSPSEELIDLFNVSWKIIYTLNIDDTIENIRTIKSGQSLHFYNARNSKAVEHKSISFAHVVHLNGSVLNPDAGYLIAHSDYSRAISTDAPGWYKQAAADYLEFTPIFIGTKLNEPLLERELERAKRKENSRVGRAYVITPEKLTPLQTQSLRNRGLVHVKATLEEFSQWIRSEFSHGLTPRMIVRENDPALDGATLDDLHNKEIEAVEWVHILDPKNLSSKWEKLGREHQQRIGNLFYNGFPPTWELAGSNVPVPLSQWKPLSDHIKASASDPNAKLMVVTGQSGSGKTTATMSILLSIVNEAPDKYRLLYIKPEVKSVAQAVKVITKVFDDGRRSLVFLGDLVLFGGYIRGDLERLKEENVCLIGTARSSEWRGNFERYLKDFAKPFEFQRFEKADYVPLINKLNDFVVSPFFRKLTKKQKIERLKNSNDQLLIALKEVTGSEKFNEVIEEEYASLLTNGVKELFVITGLATLARVGISYERTAEILNDLDGHEHIETELNSLSGIVELTEGKRLVARHELYVRHLLEGQIPLETTLKCANRILQTFTKYETPVVRAVGRTDAQLFKYILNSNTIYQLAKRHGKPRDGIKVYSDLEHALQLDGHYWLQYGLYYRRLGDNKKAMDMLKKSIQAFPSNSYAVHALSETVFRYAQKLQVLDAKSLDLVNNAVASLLELDSNPYQETDEYPIVTLAYDHIAVLLAHNLKPEAKRKAKEYHDRLQELWKLTGANKIRKAQQYVLTIATGS